MIDLNGNPADVLKAIAEANGRTVDPEWHARMKAHCEEQIMTNIHIMLDLETWGTTPGSDIRSIGACVFDPTTGFVHDGTLGTIMPFYAACDNPAPRINGGSEYGSFDGPHKYPLTRDPKTLLWWSDQSDEAQAAFADSIDLKDALLSFGQWLTDITGGAGKPTIDLRLWSHGASFDPPILAAAYEAVGLPVPWHYRAPRDTRTLFDLAGITDHSDWLNKHPGPLGVNHRALDDAICQARAVCSAYCAVYGEVARHFGSID